jgi:pilus assembly protein CpaF
MSWEIILPFLRPIESLIQDPDISDILVNGPDRVFIERNGELRSATGIHLTDRALQVAIRNIARALGDDIGPEKPLLDSRLPDGSRICAILPCCSVGGTVLAIRKFHSERYTGDELVRAGSLTPEVLDLLSSAVRERKNILISGGTGAGKTTLLNALARDIPAEERIVVIEDTAELQIQAPNLVRLEARPERTGLPAVTIRDLLKATLRLRPDRILLGEVRGGEAFDLLQALNTGHSGTLATIHANSAGQAAARFTTCILQSGVELPYKAIRGNIADVLNYLVHVERRCGKRLVTQVFGIKGYDAAQDRYELERLYERE